MRGVWLWPRLARAVALVSWCNLLTSMGVIGTTICLAILRKSDLFGSRWVHPRDPNIRIVESLTKLNIGIDPTKTSMKRSRVELPGGGCLRHGFYQFHFPDSLLQWSFHISKYRENAEVARQKRLAVVRQMSTWCTAEHSICRSQQECFERDIQIPRFIIIHGFRVPRKKRHSLYMWWSMSKTGTVAEKSPLLGKVRSFLRRDTQQLTHVLIQSVFKLTPPKTKHETWKRPVGKGTIFTNHQFLGPSPRFSGIRNEHQFFCQFLRWVDASPLISSQLERTTTC